MGTRKQVVSWSDVGPAFADMVAFYTTFRNQIQQSGTEADFLPWLSGSKGQIKFADAIDRLIDDYLASKMIKTAQLRCLEVNQDVIPRFPYKSAKVTRHSGEGLAALETTEFGELYVNGRRVVLISTPPLSGEKKDVRVQDYLQEHKGGSLNDSIGFALRRHPEFVPWEWKLLREDKLPPCIALLDTELEIDHYTAVRIVWWDGTKLADGAINVSTVLNHAENVSGVILGGKMRSRLYFAVLEK